MNYETSLLCPLFFFKPQLSLSWTKYRSGRLLGNDGQTASFARYWSSNKRQLLPKKALTIKMTSSLSCPNFHIQRFSHSQDCSYPKRLWQVLLCGRSRRTPRTTWPSEWRGSRSGAGRRRCAGVTWSLCRGDCTNLWERRKGRISESSLDGRYSKARSSFWSFVSKGQKKGILIFQNMGCPDSGGCISVKHNPTGDKCRRS